MIYDISQMLNKNKTQSLKRHSVEYVAKENIT